MAAVIGATFGVADPHSTSAVIISKDVGLFDFVIADNTLCQIADIEVSSNIGLEDAKKIANGRKKAVKQDVVAKLSVIGQYSRGRITRANHPVPPGTKIVKASKKVIKQYLGIDAGDVEVGCLLRRPDVRVSLGREIFNNHVAVIGMTNQGKSNIGKILVDQMTKMKMRVVVIDPHGEYSGRVIKVDNGGRPSRLNKSVVFKVLRENVPSGMNKALEDTITGVEYGEYSGSLYEKLMKAADDEYDYSGKDIKTYIKNTLQSMSISMELEQTLTGFRAGRPIVINLKGVKKAQSQDIVGRVAELCLKEGKAGKGFFLVVDEAHRFMPQKATPPCKEAMIDLAQEGRKFGCGMVILSQRPANIDKDILSQCNTKFCMKVVNDNDIRQIRYSTEYATVQMFREVQILQVGEALLSSSMLERPVFVKIDKHGGER